MTENTPISHEDDLFARVALFNGLVTREQINECRKAITASVISDQPQPSMPATMLSIGVLAEDAVAMLQKVIDARRAKEAGLTASGTAGLTPEPLPMDRPAPIGTSGIFKMPTSWRKKKPSSSFDITISAEEDSATLTTSVINLHAAERPAFEVSLRRLLDSGKNNLYIDWPQVQNVASMLIGEMGKANLEAGDQQRSLVLRTNKKIEAVTRTILAGSLKTLITE